MAVSTLRGKSASPTWMALNRTRGSFLGQSSFSTSGWWRHRLPAPLGWEISSCPCSFLERSGCCPHDSRERGVRGRWWWTKEPSCHLYSSNMQIFFFFLKQTSQTSWLDLFIYLFFFLQKGGLFYKFPKYVFNCICYFPSGHFRTQTLSSRKPSVWLSVYRSEYAPAKTFLNLTEAKNCKQASQGSQLKWCSLSPASFLVFNQSFFLPSPLFHFCSLLFPN